MKSIILFFFLSVLAIESLCQTQNKTAIIHVSVVDVENGILLNDQTVVIENGKIISISSFAKNQNLNGYKIISAKGKYLIPGLIDSHIHLFFFFKNNQQQLLQVPLNMLVYYGITGIRDASASTFTQEMVALRDSIVSGKKLGPKIYVSAITTVGNLNKLNVPTYTDLVKKYKQLGVDGIKIKFTTFNETKEVIDAAHALQLPVFGHTANAWKPDSNNVQGDFTPGIVDYGIDGVMHSGGYAPVVFTKLPLPPPMDSVMQRWVYMEKLWFHADEKLEAELIKKMVDHHVWLEPTFAIEEILPAREQYKNNPELKFSMITYHYYVVGWPTLKDSEKDSLLNVFKRKQLFVKRFHDAGGMVLAGTDNLFGSSLHKELELLVGAGLSPADALKAATYNNAKALGWLDQLGTVTPGKKANLVLLDKNPLKNISNTKAIHAVILNGEVLDRRKLDQLYHAAEGLLSNVKH